MASRRPAVVFMMGSLGDTIVCLPALRHIAERERFNGGLILLYPAVAADLVSPVTVLREAIEFTEAIEYAPSAKRAWNRWLPAWRRLRRTRARRVYFLGPTSRTRLQRCRDRLFFASAGQVEQFGFGPAGFVGGSGPGEAEARIRRLQTADEAEVQRCLLMPLIKPSLGDRQAVRTRVESLGLDLRRRLVVVCPGAKQPANQWFEERWVEVVAALAARGDCAIALCGGPRERELSERIAATAGAGIPTAGAFTLHENAALFASAELVIGLDTGTTHLASAVGTRCLTIFGAQALEGRWAPLGSRNIVLRNKVPCDNCGLAECIVPGHPCMHLHRSSTVIQAATRMLAEPYL